MCASHCVCEEEEDDAETLLKPHSWAILEIFLTHKLKLINKCLIFFIFFFIF